MHQIAMYGGAFDPVHNTHLSLAQAAITHLGLDQLLWVPTGHALHKVQALTPAHHRVAMLELALCSVPGAVQVQQINASEINRFGVSYTVDTLTLLQQEAPHAHWYVIMGADQFAALHTWKNWQEIASRCTLAVAGRAGVDLHAYPKVLECASWVEIPVLESGISSSQVRELARQTARGSAQAKNQLAALVPACVLNYIEQHHLYQ